MKLVFDIGNTRLKWGLADSGKLVQTGYVNVDEFTPIKLAQQIDHLDRIQEAYLCSVAAPSILESVVAWLNQQQQINSTVVHTQKTACGISNNYTAIEQLGVDRWIAALGARSLRAEGDLIIIDVGTALTIDWLSAENVFEGGVILPGHRLMHDALVGRTAGIQSEYLDNRQIIGKSTHECVNSGIGYGLAGGVERIVNEMCNIINNPVLILLTGGGAEALNSKIHLSARYEPHLVLLGLLDYAQQGNDIRSSGAR